MLTFFVDKKIVLYTSESGRCPVADFLNTLTDKVVQKISWVLKLISQLDRIPTEYLKKLKTKDDIWECRIAMASNSYRIFCFFDNGSIIVLTHGIVKKSQKTPRNEIKKAIECKKDYLRRKQ